MATQTKARSLFDGPIVRRAVVDAIKKLDPRIQVRNPVMFVVLVGSVLTTGLWLQALLGQGEAPAGFIFWISVWLWFTVLFANFAEAMAEGRGKAQAEALRRTRQDVQAKRLARPERAAAVSRVVGQLAPAGRRRPRRGRRRDSRRRRGDRGRRLGGRERHHGRERPRHPRERRRPERRHRRNPRALRLADRPHQREPRRGVPRPHDRHGRGRQAPEDPERDRAQHPAGGLHDHLPPGDGHAPSLLALQRRRRRARDAGDRHGPGCPARLPDPHDDRRAALRDRDRGHGPDAPGERDRHVGPRRRGRRRRRRAAARQDRHDHARKPAGHRVPAGPRRRRARSGRRRPARLAGRRDPRRAEHRRARQAEVRDPGAGRATGWAPPSWRSPLRPG